MAEVIIERKQVRISLDGFFVSTSSPTEEALKITVDCTDLPWDRFGQLIRDLQDELTALDRDFAARSERIRGRKIIGGHRKEHRDEHEDQDHPLQPLPVSVLEPAQEPQEAKICADQRLWDRGLGSGESIREVRLPAP